MPHGIHPCRQCETLIRLHIGELFAWQLRPALILQQSRCVVDLQEK